MKTEITYTNPTGGAVPSACRRLKKAKSLAAKYDVCGKTIFRMADEKHIHRYKINARLVLFDEAEVAAYIEQSRIAH